MNYQDFLFKKVVFKFPYRNKACFTFVSAFELVDILRLATKEEVEKGERIDKVIYDKNGLIFDEQINFLINNDFGFKKNVEEMFNLIVRKEEELSVIKENLLIQIIDFFENNENK